MRSYLRTRAAYPKAVPPGGRGSGRTSADAHPSAWLCSQWGLPGHHRYRQCRWSLTPPFHPHVVGWGVPTRRRGLFLWPCPRVAPSGCYPALHPAESGLSSFRACCSHRNATSRSTQALPLDHTNHITNLGFFNDGSCNLLSAKCRGASGCLKSHRRSCQFAPCRPWTMIEGVGENSAR